MHSIITTAAVLAAGTIVSSQSTAPTVQNIQPKSETRTSKKMGIKQRRRLVTAAPDLPIELVDTNSPILEKIDKLDFFIAHGKNPKPASIQAVENLRAEIKQCCSAYEPVPVENMHLSGSDDSFPFLADRKGILCASGTKGFAVFRGALCTKVCKVADTEHDKRGFVSLESLVAPMFRSQVLGSNDIQPTV